METCTETEMETCTISVTKTKTEVWEVTVKETATLTTTEWWDSSKGGECWPRSMGCTDTVYATMTIDGAAMTASGELSTIHTGSEEVVWDVGGSTCSWVHQCVSSRAIQTVEGVAVTCEGGPATWLGSETGSAIAAGGFANSWSGASIPSIAIASSPAATASSASVATPSVQRYVASNGGGRVSWFEKIFGYIWSILFFYMAF